MNIEQYIEEIGNPAKMTQKLHHKRGD